MPAPNPELRVEGGQRLVRFLNIVTDEMVSPRFLNRIGNFVRTRIKSRTLVGVDADGHAFKPYSPSYKLFRIKHRRPANKVDLFYSGSMLNAIDYQVRPREVRIFIRPGTDSKGTSNPAKAYYIQNKQKRKFFAVSAADELKIRAMFEERVKGIIDRGGRQ